MDLFIHVDYKHTLLKTRTQNTLITLSVVRIPRKDPDVVGSILRAGEFFKCVFK